MADEENGPKEISLDQAVEGSVVGPPAFGSPDPETATNRLVTLDQHPNRDSIDPSYGADVKAEDVMLDEETTEEAADEEPSEFDEFTVDELKDMARDADIEGFSTMKKAELIAALKAVEES